MKIASYAQGHCLFNTVEVIVEQTSVTRLIPSTQVRVAEAVSTRIVVLDQLRGIAMILMALEHVAYFANVKLQAESFGGVRPDLPPLPNVLVGMLTHQASGIFFTLVGTSIAYFEASRRRRSWTEWQISSFLVTRALILLVLDQVVGLFGWKHSLTFDVLSAIGFSLILLSILRLLPLRVIAVTAIVLFLLYPLLVQAFPYRPDQPHTILLSILLDYKAGGVPRVEFAALSRLSLVLIGFVGGHWLQQRKFAISARLIWIALAGLIIAFVLRLLGGYGNFLPYQPNWSPIYFFIENKQPPSIVFLLSNFSIALIWLVALNAWQRHINDVVREVLTVFGQSSLFFYTAHVFIYRYVGTQLIPQTFLSGGNGLGRAFFDCALGLTILYPACLVYRHLRQKYPCSIIAFL